MKSYFAIGLFAFAVSLVLTPLMRKVAFRFGILDAPSSSIKTHKISTPYLGGVAIFLGIVAAASLVYYLRPDIFDVHSIIYLSCILVVFVCGLIDDIRPMKPVTRLVIHFAVAATAVSQGYHTYGVFPVFINYILSAIWIAGVINAMNIIDIMDGLASGVALAVCASMVGAIYFMNLDAGFSFPMVMAVITAGACLGFLPHNFEKASIFMGDAGSTTLGFLIGTLSLKLPTVPGSAGELFLPLLFVGVPVFDVALVSVLRIKKGMSPLKGSKDHFALRLRRIGVPVKQIVVYSWMASLLLAAAAVIYLSLPDHIRVIPIIAILIGAYMFASIISKVDMNG